MPKVFEQRFFTCEKKNEKTKNMSTTDTPHL